MRIVRKWSVALGYKAPPEAAKDIKFGWEDVLFVMVVVLLAIGYVRNQLTLQEFLAYLGINSTGGIWGFIGGASSSK